MNLPHIPYTPELPHVPLLLFIVGAIPESISLIALSFALLKLKLDWNRIFPLGILMGFIIYGTRLLPITPGEHILLIFIVYVLALNLLTSINFIRVFFVVLAGLVLLALAESAFTVFFSWALKISYEEVMGQPLPFGLPQIIILFTAAILVNKYNRSETTIKAEY